MNKIEENCLFCRIAQGLIKKQKIAETNNFIAILDIKNHYLIIPKKHFVTILDIPNNLGEELLTFSKQLASKILDNKQGDGFNILMNNLKPAGQIINHASIILIPRKENDRLRIIS